MVVYDKVGVSRKTLDELVRALAKNPALCRTCYGNGLVLIKPTSNESRLCPDCVSKGLCSKCGEKLNGLNDCQNHCTVFLGGVTSLYGVKLSATDLEHCERRAFDLNFMLTKQLSFLRGSHDR